MQHKNTYINIFTCVFIFVYDYVYMFILLFTVLFSEQSCETFCNAFRSLPPNLSQSHPQRLLTQVCTLAQVLALPQGPALW